MRMFKKRLRTYRGDRVCLRRGVIRRSGGSQEADGCARVEYDEEAFPHFEERRRFAPPFWTSPPVPSSCRLHEAEGF